MMVFREWIAAENINDLFLKHQVPPEFDILSIDIDYNDFWVWNAIDQDRYKPRVVIVEYNAHIPPLEARTVPYNATGTWDGKTRYFGAGIGAFNVLAQKRGYSLVYCESHGVNCFFVRNDALGLNIGLYMDIEVVHRPPNFFGMGWKYPERDTNETDPWIWVMEM